MPIYYKLRRGDIIKGNGFQYWFDTYTMLPVSELHIIEKTNKGVYVTIYSKTGKAARRFFTPFSFSIMFGASFNKRNLILEDEHLRGDFPDDDLI